MESKKWKVKKYFDGKMVGIRGSGKCISQLDKQCDIVTCDTYTFY
jgi:hypothetical protein